MPEKQGRNKEKVGEAIRSTLIPAEKYVTENEEIEVFGTSDE